MPRKALMAAAAVVVVGGLAVIAGRDYPHVLRAAPGTPPALVLPPATNQPAPSEGRPTDEVRFDRLAKVESPEARRSVGEYQYASAATPEQESGWPYWQPTGTADERYGDVAANPVKLVAEQPVSTFSVDVDTAAYANVRRFLTDGVLPPVDAVRTEELINYFSYDYPLPESSEAPFRADVALFDSPWDEGSRIIRIGLQGYDIPAAVRPPANLVFLVDTSGSMDSPDKLPLLKQSLRLLTEQMRPEDSVAIVAYAGDAGVVLESTKGSERLKIRAAIDAFAAGGSTAGAEGIRQAYALAEAAFRKEAVNRVILATDGDFNVGITDPGQLEDFVARKRESGVYLSILGFGTGNLNDLLMQKLAQAGNGNAAYIDSLMEARKVLVEEMGSTVFTIADDVKIQIEFNPAEVAEYRLIGYETRLLAREDFNNDKVDAGDVGSGHSVTALYEITPPDSASRLVDDLRYGGSVRPAAAADGELAYLRIRYKLPGADESRLIEQPVLASARTSFEAAPVDARFATAVAAFGQLLRNDPHVGRLAFADIHRIGRAARGADEFGYRSEFLRLVQAAGSAAALETLN
ncbi:MAG: von Willebrand factor type A domain-containing protein [Dongiaceae bacterium]